MYALFIFLIGLYIINLLLIVKLAIKIFYFT